MDGRHKMNPLFTVGFVNYKTSLYMETQFKIYQHFAGEDVKIIVVDTSNLDEEFAALNEIVKKFNIPIQTIQLDFHGKYASDAHGSGLQYIYEIVDTDYFLTQDPDFFWVLPSFLTFFKEKLQDHVVVGAPYHLSALADWSGHPWFPAAFGAAHDMKALHEVNADFRYSTEPIPGVNKQIDRDVGWLVREKLKNRSYYYFSVMSAQLPIGKTYSNNYWQKYLDGQTTVAYHLQRGSFETQAKDGLRLAYHGRVNRRERLRTMRAPKEWQRNRKKACEFFWEEINKAAEKKNDG